MWSVGQEREKIIREIEVIGGGTSAQRKTGRRTEARPEPPVRVPRLLPRRGLRFRRRRSGGHRQAALLARRAAVLLVDIVAAAVLYFAIQQIRGLRAFRRMADA